MADKDVMNVLEVFDRLLRQELSITPSPAFHARVRERVAEQQRTPWWRARWIPAIGSVATVASIAVALVVPSVARWTSAPMPPTPPSVNYPTAQEPRLDPSAPVPAISRVSAPRASVRRAVELDGAPVIVDRRERAALVRFVNMVQQGRLGEEAFAHTSRPAMASIDDTLGPIVVAPVVVSRISVSGVLSSEK